MSPQKPLAMGWKVSALNVGMASIRYRALFPLLSLSEQGVTSKVFASGWAGNLDGVDVLVIVKSFTADDIALAQAAVDRGIPVIYDLCDNVFVDGYGYNSMTSPIDVVRQIALVTAAFVTPTEALADVLRDQLGEHLVVHVIPDGIETSNLSNAAAEFMMRARESERRRSLFLRVRDFLSFRLLLCLLKTASVRGITYRLVKYVYTTLEPIRAWVLGRPSRLVLRTASSTNFSSLPQWIQNKHGRFLCLGSSTTSDNPRRLLWYGNHGAKHGGSFGMSDLVDNRAALESIAARFDIELVVVSNSVDKFHQLIAPLAIPSRYVEWTPAAVQEELARAEIVLVPNSGDAFSICKSANRTALALMAGRPVVATPTPALIPLASCIGVGDLYTGIQHYLTDPQLVASHLAIARERCEQLYGQGAIAGGWQMLLDAIRSKVNPPQSFIHPGLIVVANLVQDIEFIRPIVAAAQKCDITVVIWASTSMIRRWPYTLAALAQSGAGLRVLAETADGAVLPPFPRSVRAVLTVADTNLGPHRFSYSITQAANHAGIMTGTLQHGFENVGLTYTDNLQMIERVEFEARRIFVWGDLSLLHPAVNEKTRSKCIPVGCPKLVRAGEKALLPSVLLTGKPIIGIFENLHWHRYDEAYRSFFLEGVLSLVLAHPEVIFVFKSHNAGRWLTTRFDGELAVKENLLIADSSEPQWEGLTAADLLPYMNGIITSPSTVALDAARAELPVAVVAHDLLLDNYAPLYQIRNADEWVDFASNLFDGACKKRLIDNSKAFVARVILPGDAATSIVRSLLNADLDKQGLAA